jgi:hypothetical protein
LLDGLIVLYLLADKLYGPSYNTPKCSVRSGVTALGLHVAQIAFTHGIWTLPEDEQRARTEMPHGRTREASKAQNGALLDHLTGSDRLFRRDPRTIAHLDRLDVDVERRLRQSLNCPYRDTQQRTSIFTCARLSFQDPSPIDE